MTLEVEAGILEEMIYNVLLWTPGKGDAKKVLSEGLVEVQFDEDDISFMSTDGYVSVRTATTDKAIRRERVFVQGWELKAAGAEVGKLEASSKSEIKLEVDAQGNRLWIGPGFVEIHTPKTDIGFWNYMSNIMRGSIEVAQSGPFAIDPRRLTKFSLLAPRETYPVDFIHREVGGGHPVIFWKHGPRTRGMVSPLSRQTLSEAFAEEKDVLW